MTNRLSRLLATLVCVALAPLQVYAQEVSHKAGSANRASIAAIASFASSFLPDAAAVAQQLGFSPITTEINAKYLTGVLPDEVVAASMSRNLFCFAGMSSCAVSSNKGGAHGDLIGIGALHSTNGSMTGPLAAQLLTATDPGTSAGNPFVFTSREATNTGGGFRYGFLMNHERLAGGVGNRTAGVFMQAVDATSKSSDQIVGLEPIGMLKSGVVAQAYGSNPVCQTLPGTANGAGCTGEEIDINSAATGLTRRTGLQIYDIGSAAPASQIDAALFFAGNPATSPPSMPFANGILFGYAGNNSTINVASNGCMICAGAPGTVAGGINFASLMITGAFLSGPQGTFTVDGAGNTTVGKTSAPANLTVTNNIASSGSVSAHIFVEALFTPASSTSPCSVGQFADDANYHYVCVAANHWKRVALSSF